MNKSEFASMVDDVIKGNLEIADEYIKDVIDEIGDIGSPEKLIGKVYEDWSPEDLQRLVGIYGQGGDTPLAKLIATKSYAEVIALEQEA
jgi:hypothetical protein